MALAADAMHAFADGVKGVTWVILSEYSPLQLMHEAASSLTFVTHDNRCRTTMETDEQGQVEHLLCGWSHSTQGKDSGVRGLPEGCCHPQEGRGALIVHGAEVGEPGQQVGCSNSELATLHAQGVDVRRLDIGAAVRGIPAGRQGLQVKFLEGRAAVQQAVDKPSAHPGKPRQPQTLQVRREERQGSKARIGDGGGVLQGVGKVSHGITQWTRASRML